MKQAQIHSMCDFCEDFYDFQVIFYKSYMVKDFFYLLKAALFIKIFYYLFKGVSCPLTLRLN